jgi:NAD(P)-dependent dehydrogenase (short-subunit alcohol dehydrogenase family)
MNELRFDGKVAIITGAGRGVGRTHALALASRGAKVVVADRGVAVDGSGKSDGPASDVVREIKAAGGEAVASFESVADEKGAAAIIQTALDTYGHLDILVNNAGINGPNRFENLTTDDFRSMVNVHYLGTVYVTKAAWPHLIKAKNGRIVNTASEGPLGIHEMMTAYGGAKGGVIGFTFALASEGAKYGIGVNGFSPRIATRMSAPEVLAHVYEKPVEAFAHGMVKFPPELATPAVVYLAHESCTYTGVILVCGGGQVLRMAVMENMGFTTEGLTPEKIAANIGQVLDMSKGVVVGIGAGGASSMPETKLAGGH